MTTGRKRRNVPTAARRRKPSAIDANEKIALLTRERDEALEQQTATSDVLRVISSSPGELEPVFEAMLQNATRICEATFGNMFLYEHDAFRTVAMQNAPPAYSNVRAGITFHPPPSSALGRLAAAKAVVQIADLMAEDSYIKRDPFIVAAVELGGIRTILAVPMLNDDRLIGAIIIYRQEVRPFTDKQIELVKNFAAQAVIAIENVRLLNELRQRTDDLSEALEQQTATSEVLKVISSSPGELEPVFQAMLENATRICQAQFGTMNLYDGNAFRNVALHNPPPQYAMRQGQVIHPHPESGLGYVVRTKQIAHIDDLRTTRPYLERNQAVVSLADLADARTVLIVPMLKENKLIGAITIFRQEVRSFTDKQIDLVTNFAAQAVIAIENTRLLKELRQRTDDLSESLEQQTATSEVLKVISSSPGDLEPVFVAMLANAVRICGANFGNIYRWSDDALHLLATHNTPPAFADVRRNSPFRPGPDTPTGRMVATKSMTHVADLAAEPRATEQDDRDVRFGVDVGGIRTLLSVPMLKENELVGAFTIYRQEVRPFTDKQIELVQNFAAQAVIAIENTRLLSELRQRTDDLTEVAGATNRYVGGAPGHFELDRRPAAGI